MYPSKKKHVVGNTNHMGKSMVIGGTNNMPKEVTIGMVHH